MLGLKKRGKAKQGQVWIETVLYTLIALSLIALVLAFVRPKIEQSQDRIVLEQTIDALNRLDDQIFSVRTGGTGNVRTPELSLKEGSLTIDGTNEKIIYEMDETRLIYSEPGVPITDGKIEIMTTKGSRYNKIELTLNYVNSGINLAFKNDEMGVKQFTKSASSYKLRIENSGEDSLGTKTKINFDLI